MNSEEPVNQQRVLMATDVPFWRKSTGAQQRMASLVRFLTSECFQVRTFFLGQTDTEQFTQDDRKLIAANGLDVEQRSSDQPPQQFARKVGWHADAAIHRIKQWSGPKNTRDAKRKEPTSKGVAPRLEEYRWPWAITAFAESVQQFQPNSIIVQYIKLNYLLEALTDRDRNKIKCIVDTHDVLHLRAQQFRDRGFDHWIELNREEESDALSKFDMIVAIQPDEARLFREMAPRCQTIVCGHAGQPVRESDSRQRPSGQLTVGYVGSANASNADAIQSFLEQVWRRLQDSNVDDEIELVIAGSICEWIAEQKFGADRLTNVQLLGHVQCLDSFYERVDLVVNPVEFGTGLKIKNCEALAFGTPIITTPHGILGMASDTESATLVCDSTEAFCDCLGEILRNPDRLERLQTAATKLSQTGFSEQQVYSELKQALLKEK